MKIVPGTIPNPLEDRVVELEKLVQQLQERLNSFGVVSPIPYDYNLNWSLQKTKITDHPDTKGDPVNY